MPETLPFTYKAFLSYSHADTKMAVWLHKRLEGFPLRGLSGRLTALGTVPKQLRPIFRDREDFSAGHSLSEQTIANLDGSAALIALCSPASARSHNVNEEIRLFKARNPERPVVPVIVDGKPGDPARECFAPALRFEVDASGTVTDRLSEVLAADLREMGDGRELALAKVVAALIGVPSDEVYRRAERERGQQGRIRNTIAALILLLAGGGGYLGWQSHTQRQTLAEIEAVVDPLAPVGSAQAQQQGTRENLTAAIKSIARGASLDPRQAQAYQLLKAGKPQDAEVLLRAVDSLAIADRLAKADPNNAGWQRDLSVSYSKVGDVLVAQGNLPEALKSFRDSLAIADRLAKADPNNAGWQRDLSVSYDRVGDVLVAQGNLPEALKSFRDSLAIRDRLAKADPNNAQWQRDLAVSHSKLAGIYRRQGEADKAKDALAAGKAIMERMTKLSPDNVAWKHDLAWFESQIAALDKDAR